ncbi:hypothetical protein [Viridibacillus arvi]|uniref:hypothetical protein n=1 Tax=Viridibacillus arvi TaxID=263475 RepID=UPI003D2E795C
MIEQGKRINTFEMFIKDGYYARKKQCELELFVARLHGDGMAAYADEFLLPTIYTIKSSLNKYRMIFLQSTKPSFEGESINKVLKRLLIRFQKYGIGYL